MSKRYCPYCMAPVAEGESCSVCGLTEGTYKPSPHHLPPGTVLMDRYLVGRVLGEGGFGITYIGCDLRLEMKAAIKEYYPMDRATRNASASLEISSFIGPSSASYERGKQKFLSEAQVMARMDKQQVIVSVRDFFEGNNTAYIVMEYIEGITFHELVEQKGGKIPPEELFPMIEPLLYALSAIHENGLIHRDISPDNLMLENGRIRLLDFGCAREASRGTETMTIALKHGYAPIEQYQQKGQGPWTDIYALSATIYYCLTGKVPPQALDRIAGDELLLPSRLGVNLSDGQERALLKGMRVQPSRRFSSVRELWAALYTTSAQEPEKFSKADTAETDAAGSGTAERNAAVPDTTWEDMPKNDFVWEAREGMEDSGGMGNSGDLGNSGSMGNSGDLGNSGGMESSSGLENPSGTADSGSLGNSGGLEAAEDAAGKEAAQEVHGKKKIYYRNAAIAAACIALVIFAAGMFRQSFQDGTTPDSKSTAAGSSAADGTSAAGNGTADENSAADGSGTTDETTAEMLGRYNALFQDAYVFTSGSAEDFQKLMEDESVSAVIMDGRSFDVREAHITKPVLLKEGSLWQLDSLTISGEGYLQAAGELWDGQDSGYIRLKKGGTRLYVEENGIFNAEDTVIWMDEPDSIVMGTGKNISAHTLVFDEDVFTDAVSVSDEKELLEAVEHEQGKAVCINGDITLAKEVCFTGPVQIAEGVTVHTVFVEDDKERIGFCLNEGGVLVNNGTLDGNLWVSGSSAVLNNGMLAGEEPGMVQGVSLWIEKNAVLVNFGTVEARDVSRFWENSMCVNMGTVHAYELHFLEADMINFGDIIVHPLNECEENFEIKSGSWLWNKEGASVTAADGANFYNLGRIHNREGADILIQSGGHYSNGLLENNGSFRAEHGAELDADKAGVYYGEGSFDLGYAQVKTYPVSHICTCLPNEQKQAHITQVKSEKELIEALENAEAEAVWITSDISVNTNLTVKKTIFVGNSCSLTLKKGAELRDYGGCIVLVPGASLNGSRISLYDDAQISLWPDSSLHVEKGGSLTLDGALLWGEGDVQLNGAEFTLRNQAGLALYRSAAFEADGSEIKIQDGAAFVTPFDTVARLTGAAITMEKETSHLNPFFLSSANAILTDCSLDVGAGTFYNGSDHLIFRNCSAVIEPDACFESSRGSLSLVSGSSLENKGAFSVGAWDEHTFTVHGSVVNSGRMYIYMRTDLTEPIDNQGEIEIQKGRLEASYVAGNTPVIYE